MQPQQDQYTPQPAPLVGPKKRNGRKIAGLILVITPSALIILNILVSTLLTFAFRDASGNSELFGDRPTYAAWISVFSLLLGGLGFLAWLPCLVIGIILLATQKPQ
jgi:hypothetical protein